MVFWAKRSRQNTIMNPNNNPIIPKITSFTTPLSNSSCGHVERVRNGLVVGLHERTEIHHVVGCRRASYRASDTSLGKRRATLTKRASDVNGSTIVAL